MEIYPIQRYYMEPAEFLLNRLGPKEIRDGGLYAASTLLLCLIDHLAALVYEEEEGSRGLFVNFYNEYLMDAFENQKKEKFEFYPASKSPNYIGTMIYEFYRCPAVHNGSSLNLKTPYWKEKLCDWAHIGKLTVVDRRGKHPDHPCFALDIEAQKIILDAGKLFEKLKEVLNEQELLQGDVSSYDLGWVRSSA